jgi:RHS repeat-associated protein
VLHEGGGWQRVPTSARFSKQKISLTQVAVKEAGYVFVYLSYEDQSNNYVYFDDFKITHTKSNLIQGNEYYPFGMQTANSWTREAVTGNNYLANGGTELNATTQLYDLHYRNYDAALGRMFQLDPMASKYGSLTPYNYSLNNPTNLNDPLGDDVEPQPPYPREYLCAQCWREGENLTNYMKVSGGGMYGGWSGGGFYGGGGPMGAYWHPGDGRMFWSGYESGARDYRHDQDRVRYGDMSQYEFYKKYPGYTKVNPSHFGAFAAYFNEMKNGIKANLISSQTASAGDPIDGTDQTLNQFLADNFGSAYGKYGECWSVDANGEHGAKGDVLGVTSRSKNKISVYINPKAFRNAETLFMTVVHEFVHVYLLGSGKMDIWIKEFKSRDLAGHVSEFYAYAWSAQVGQQFGYQAIGTTNIFRMFDSNDTKFYIPWDIFHPILKDTSENGLAIWKR